MVTLVAASLAACTPSGIQPPHHGWTMVARAVIGQTPGPVTLGGQWAFVANMGDGTVSQLSRSTGRVVATIRVADPHALLAQGCAPDSVHAYYSGSWGWRACDTPYAIAWDGAALWALDNGDRALVEVDPNKQVTARRIPLPGTGWSVAIYAGTAYVSGFADAHGLYVVNLRSGDVATIDDLDTGPATLSADATGVWVACARAGAGRLDRIDLAARRVTARYQMEWWSTAVLADHALAADFLLAARGVGDAAPPALARRQRSATRAGDR